MENLSTPNVYQRALRGAFLICAALLPLSSQASFQAQLQGQNTNSTVWFSGNLMGWRELDYIPCRVYLTGGPATNQAIRVDFDHIRSHVPGVEDLVRWTNSSNVTMTTPILICPAGAVVWSYSFNITVTDGNPGFVEFRARLAAGSHLNAGSSLALGGSPSLGSLQIHKPAAAPGLPDLQIVKRGPATVARAEIITYTINWTNNPNQGSNSVGAQITDVLPPDLTYVSNSASGGMHIVGDTLIWDLGSLAMGARGSMTYQAVVDPQAAYGQTFANYAQILSAENDFNSADNVSSVQTTVIFNRPPACTDDAYILNEDTQLTVAAPGVLANDSDADGDALTAAIVSPPTHGSLTFNANGSFTYAPAANYNGFDSFVYRASDGHTNGFATVNLTIRPVNDPPVAQNDSYALDQNTTLTIAAPGVLVNDSDVDGDTLTAAVVTGPAHGSLALNSNGSFTYTPTAGYNGSDSFTYKASDGKADATATVNLSVHPVNDPPVAVTDTYITDEDTVLTVAAPGVLANDTDIDGDVLTASLITGPAHGSLTLNSSGGFTYTPVTNYNGADSFTYKASDGQASSTATVNLTVRSVNDPPVAVNDTYATDEDTVLTVAAPGVLANDSDIDGDVLAAILVTNPAHGSVTLNTNGGFIYTPAADYNGPDSFTYKASDGQADASATVNLTIRPVNDAPVAVDDAYATDEDTILTVAAPGVLANDSDVDGDALTAILVTSPAHGSLTLNTNGGFTYTPAADYNGPDSFTYKVSDGQADATATVNLTVRPVNDPPVAVADSYVTDEDTMLTVAAPGVLANDSDIDGDVLAAILVTNPAHGSLTLNSDGSFTYTPATNYNGPDFFTYKASDGQADATATVNLTVRPVNDPPVAVDDTYTTDEDTALTIAAPGVLANDSDVDGDALTAILVTSPAHGSLTLNTNGGFTYTPATNYNGPDSFTYKASDGQADATATVTLTVRPVNDPPVAQNDAYATDEDTTLTIAGPGVLANDSDIDGDALTAILVTSPVHGSLTLNTNGGFTYTPATNYNGPDSFIYKASDGQADATATVNLTVRPVNDAPVAVDDAYATDEDTILTIAAPGVLANDSDVDGDTLTAIVVSNPAHGSLTLNTNGGFTYTPAADYNGPDSFTYKASDGQADATATVTLTVRPVNDPPVAQNDAYAIDEDTTLTIAAPGVLANDSDIDGDVLTATVLTGPAHGSLTLNTNGGFIYTPAPDYNGPDSFTYKASDGQADATATVNLTVRPVNDPPVAVADSYATDEDTVLNIAAPGVLANDTDIDGDVLTAILVTNPAHGSLTLNTNGGFTYTPATNYNGPDSFTYKASDGQADATATVSLTVRPVNDAPVAVNDTYATDEDTVLTVAAPGVLANDTDIDGDVLTAILVTNPAHGSLTLNTNGGFTYTPAANYNGPDSFTYKASDGQADATATVNLTVRPVNDPPVAVAESYATDEDTVLTIATPGVLANDTDIDGDTLTAILVSNPAHGSLTLNTNGGFTYTPATNYNGPDSFTYKASDGQADAIATVSLTVRPVNDAPVAVNDTYATDEDTVLTVAAPGVLANDSDIDGDALTAILVTSPAHGSLTLNTNGGFTYTPAANYNGPDSFTYKASDGQADATATVTLTVRPVNDPPVAVADSYATDEDTVLNIAAPGVLANDSDIDGDVLTAILVTNPAHGSLTLNTNGGFTYTPAANYNGPDSFTYKASDGQLSANATVTLLVRPVNDPPVAVNDTYATDEDTVLTVAAPGVLANDSDIDGDVLTAILITSPAHGSLTLNTNGSFSYTPNANYNGPDSFTYKASDGQADATATVNLTVRPVNDPPVAVADSYATDEDTVLTIAAPGVLANDSDVDGDTLTVAVVTGPAHGSLTLNSNGSFTYTPTANYNGPDSFIYKASDGQLSANATVTLLVRAVNDPPVALNDNFQAIEDTALTIAAPGVLANDSDVDGDTLTATLVSGPAHGSVTLNLNGSFNYTPAADYNGPDSFTYKASDGQADATATVTLNVGAVNDAPSFANGPNQLVGMNSGAHSLVNWATAISAGPADEAGQALSFTATNDRPGLFSAAPAIAPNGTLTFTPAPDAYGVATVTVTLHDDGGTANGGVDTSAPATFTITVNSPPTVNILNPTNNAHFTVPANFTVMADAFDPDGSITNVEIFAGATLLIRTNTSPCVLPVSSVPPGNYQFTARATDNLGVMATSAPVSISVTGALIVVTQAMHLDLQTGLFIEKVQVTTPIDITSLRLLISDLAANVRVWNASGTNNSGVPFVQIDFDQPLPAGGSVILTLEFFVPNRVAPNPTLTADLTPAPLSLPTPQGAPATISRQLALPNGTFMIEWMSEKGKTYYVQYSSDMRNWRTAYPAVTGTGTRQQWVDDGPPKTQSLPSRVSGGRFYRLLIVQ